MYLLIAFIISVIAFRIYLQATDQYLHFHSQNLHTQEKPGPLWRHGRCWLHVYFREDRKNTRYPSPTINLNWTFGGSHSTGIGFDFASEEEDFSFRVSVNRLFFLALDLSGIPIFYRLFRSVRRGFGYDTSIKVFDQALWIHAAYNELWGARHIEPNWLKHISIWSAAAENGFGFYISIHYLDILLGRQKYTSENLGEPVDIDVQLHPDTTILRRKYMARVQMQRATWKRPRWPFPVVVTRADIECIPPIPIPGKGESDWDLDDDAIHSMTTVAASPAEAVEHLVASVQLERRKYGLPDEIYVAMEKESQF